MKKILVLIIVTFLILQACSSNESPINSNNSTQNTFPQLSTISVSYITPTTSISGGNINSNGGASITNRGIVWSTQQNPTISLTTKTSDGSGVGIFTSNLSGLIPGTKYYARAYATNSVGTAYGNEISFITLSYSYVQGSVVNDIDGNSYPTIITNCNNQVWMQKNLNVTKYRNGDSIPQVTDPTQWANLTTGAWCYYQNNSVNGITYGKLYNWYAVNDPRGLAPTGYHIPSSSEWTNLTECLNGAINAGYCMKEKGNLHWQSITYQVGTGLYAVKTMSDNRSGFTGLPGGYRVHYGAFFGLNAFGDYGQWWSKEKNTNLVASFGLRYDSGQASISSSGGVKAMGFSVRCLKD